MRAIPRFELEEFFASHQGRCSINIGSSGCREFTVEELFALCGLDTRILDSVPLIDSDPSGSHELRSEIARQYANATVDEILVTHGSSEALYLLMAILVEPGDQVIALYPSYQSLVDLPRLFGAEVIRVPLRFEDGFHFPLDAVLGQLSSRTRMVIINSPHNPTGMTISAEDMGLLARETDAVGAWLLCDEAFADIVYTGSRLPAGRSMGERCISVGTLSKAFGLTGLRLGWCYAQKPLIAAMRDLKHYTTINLCPLVEFIGTAIVSCRETILTYQRDIAVTALAELSTWIRGRLDWVPPRGGVCCYPRLPRGIDSMAFCTELAVSRGVFLVPGSVFGDTHHVRLGFGHGVDHVRAGISAMEALLNSEL